MRFYSYILMLVLFSGFGISSTREKGIEQIAYRLTDAMYNDVQRPPIDRHNQLIKNAKNTDEALLSRQNKSKTSVTPAKERMAGFEEIPFFNKGTNTQTFFAAITFHTYTTLLADFKNRLLYPKHCFW